MAKVRYPFPFAKVPKGSKIVIYGAGMVGGSYGRQARESGEYEIAAFLDANYLDVYKPYHDIPLLPPEAIAGLDYDYVIIAATTSNGAMAGVLESLQVPPFRIINHVAIDARQDNGRFHYTLFDLFLRHKAGEDIAVESDMQKAMLANVRACGDILKNPEPLLRLLEDRAVFFDPLEDKHGEKEDYGHWVSMTQYAKLPLVNAIEAPCIDHGLVLENRSHYSVWQHGNPTYITLSPFRKRAIHCESSLPVFVAGPYIHYTKPSYDEAQMESEKRRLGHHLLVFPTHAWNNGGSASSDDFLDYVREQVPRYDSVRVCLYSNDFTNDCRKRYADIGVEAVCAGLREDTEFLARQKTMIMLADEILTDALATAVGYFLYLNKPVRYMRCETPVRNAPPLRFSPDWILEDIRRRDAAFTLDGFIDTAENRAHMEYMYGFGHIKTPEEMRAIFEINEYIYRQSEGNVVAFEGTIQQYVEKLDLADDPDGLMKARLLKEAVTKE